MKRIKGQTLEQIVGRLRAGDPATVEAFPQRRLLGAFATACLAIAYANARGVVPRDLKPASIILGDFGEVFVLDWGIAKVRGEAAEALSGSHAAHDATQIGRVRERPAAARPEAATQAPSSAADGGAAPVSACRSRCRPS